jgi:hypothetical protein
MEENQWRPHHIIAGVHIYILEKIYVSLSSYIAYVLQSILDSFFFSIVTVLLEIQKSIQCKLELILIPQKKRNWFGAILAERLAKLSLVLW